MTARKPRTLAALRRDPRVAEIWREDDGCFGDRPSYWLALAPGWNFDGCSCLHEPTVAALCDALARVEPGAPY